ncbi:DEAD-box ATP-dependent RNA helicase 42 [Tanacetum coccineum]|uniref:DEAD-box ATP-dependent RNA helicase 42 n=1 Tax=Tanacetum coccineum TaxID=301880 RepID=A0ABQ4XK93_9ASTR
MSNTNTNLQTQTSNALHNAIMEAGGKDRPPMLAPANYIVPVAEGSSETTTKGYIENYKNVSQDIRDQLNAEAEAVQIILTGIDNDIYSIVDACPNACEMWKAIERFYKMMNELVRNQCDVTNHQVNVQFLLQLQPEWQRFVTLVKQSQELKTVSYHKLYDILKQHQNEVNEIRAERLARTANPLALVAQQQPVYHPQNHPTHYTQNSSTRSQQAATRNRGKAIVNSPPPTYDQEPTMVAEDDEMSKDKEIDKLMALISLSFKKIYKPTNNNLRTSSNTSRENQDNTPRINRGTRYDNQRAVRMFPEESDKIEKYVGGLPNMIYRSVKASKPRTMQDAIEFSTELLNKKISTFAERSGEKKPYGGSKPLCSKCNYHHDGKCAPKCHKCNKVVHLAQDCKSPTNANNNNQRAPRANPGVLTCFECGAQGHFKKDCPKLKNRNQGNQAGVGNAVARAYAVGAARTNLNANVVTSMFLLNNHYALILFDTGADRSFVSTAFSSLIDVILITLDYSVDIELADGRIIWVNTLIRGCTLNLLNHPFNIDLMPIEMGSFDIIIGMDWLSKFQAVIICAEKIVRIPFGNEILIVCGDGSSHEHGS